MPAPRSENEGQNGTRNTHRPLAWVGVLLLLTQQTTTTTSLAEGHICAVLHECDVLHHISAGPRANNHIVIASPQREGKGTRRPAALEN